MPRPIVNLSAVINTQAYTHKQRDFTKDETIMTQLLEKVLAEVYKLPPEKQDTIAAVILEELEDERLWDKTFAESQDKLAQLARKVRTDIKADRIKKMEIDEL